MGSAKGAYDIVAVSTATAKMVGSAEVKNASAEYVLSPFEKSKDVAIEIALLQGVKWAAGNPYCACGLAVAGAGIAIVAAPGAISAALLPAAGFGPGGVQAASAAAGVHSFIGNVAGGSLFAAAQSAGAGGAGAVVVNGVIQGTGAVVATAGGAMAAFSRDREKTTVEAELEAEDVATSS